MKMAQQHINVLSEEEYTDKLNSIISQHYFPDKLSLEIELKLSEARARGANLLQIEQLSESLLHENQTPIESLDDFFKHNISEDNAEFNNNQEEELRDKRERLLLCYNGNQKTTIDNDNVCDTPLTLQLASDDFDEMHKKNKVSTKFENGLFFEPRANQFVDNSNNGIKLTTAASGTSCSNSNNKSHSVKYLQIQEKKLQDTLLMPPPPVTQKYIQTSQTRINPFNNISRKKKRRITDDEDELSSFSSSVAPSYDTDTDLDATPLSLDMARREARDVVAIRKDTKVYKFVSMEETPLHKSTAKSLESATLFKLKGESTKESAARKAESMLSHRSQLMRNQQQGAVRIRKQTGKSRNTDRSASLTPAAQQLLARATGQRAALQGGQIKLSTSARCPSALRSALRSSGQASLSNHSKKLMNTNQFTPITGRAGTYSKAVNTASQEPNTKKHSSRNTVTDGLLNL